MFKKILIATMLTAGIFCQQAWCMEGKEGEQSEQVNTAKKKAFATFMSSGNLDNSSYTGNVGDSLTTDIKWLAFSGPTGPCSVKDVTFYGLENAGKGLVIEFGSADGIDWKSLDIGMKAYKKKYSKYPKVTYVKNFLYRFIWKDNPASVYVPKG